MGGVSYRVIHESVKHFKISQQIDYATDHGNSYADRERNSTSFFLHISQMLNVSTFGVRLKRGGTQLREEGGLKGKQANGVGTQLMKRKGQVRACPALLPTIKTYNMLPSSMVGCVLSCKP
jgi:hypothetical protein